jgi:hypothetical protein
MESAKFSLGKDAGGEGDIALDAGFSLGLGAKKFRIKVICGSLLENNCR